MGGLCGSSMGGGMGGLGATLMKSYGQQTILNYVLSSIGGNLVGQKFAGLRNQLTQTFNSTPGAANNPGILETIMGNVKTTQNQFMSQVNANRVAIPQLERLPPAQRDSFINTFAAQNPTQVNSYKTGLMQQLTGALDINKFLGPLSALTGGLGGLGGMAGGLGGMTGGLGGMASGLGGMATGAAVNSFAPTTTYGTPTTTYGTPTTFTTPATTTGVVGTTTYGGVAPPSIGVTGTNVGLNPGTMGYSNTVNTYGAPGGASYGTSVNTYGTSANTATRLSGF